MRCACVLISLMEAGEHSDGGSKIVSHGVGLAVEILSGGSGETGEDFGDFGELADEHEHV